MSEGKGFVIMQRRYETYLSGEAEIHVGPPDAATSLCEVPLPILPAIVERVLLSPAEDLEYMAVYPAPMTEGKTPAEPQELPGQSDQMNASCEVVQGMVRIPPNMLGDIGVDPGRSAMVIGNGDHLEVWAPDRWRSIRAEAEAGLDALLSDDGCGDGSTDGNVGDSGDSPHMK